MHNNIPPSDSSDNPVRKSTSNTVPISNSGRAKNLASTNGTSADHTNLTDAQLTARIEETEAEERALLKDLQKQERLLAPPVIVDKFRQSAKVTLNKTPESRISKIETPTSSTSSPDEDNNYSTGTAKSNESGSDSSGSNPKKPSPFSSNKKSGKAVTFLNDAKLAALPTLPAQEATIATQQQNSLVFVFDV